MSAPQSFPSSSFSLVTQAGALTPIQGAAVFFEAEDTNLGNTISYVPATGVFTLSAGHTYECTAFITSCIFTGVTGLARFEWRNVTGAALFGQTGLQSSPTNTSHVGQCGPAIGTITVAADTTIYLEAIALTAFTSLSVSSATVRLIA